MLLVKRSAAATATTPVATLGRRGMAVAKGTSRAAVHGSRPPTNTTVEGRDEAEEAIQRGEEKQKTRKQVEDKVDAALGGGRSDDNAPTK